VHSLITAGYKVSAV